VAELDLTGYTSPVDWLHRIFAHAMDNRWTDVQLRLIRSRDDVDLGQVDQGSELTVRARIKGMMRVVATLTGRDADQAVIRIKSAAGIGSGPAIEPLDGLYPYAEYDDDGIRSRELDIRVWVTPTWAGETMALRLPATEGTPTLDELKFSPRNAALVQRILGIANGLVLLAGPMGAGKSTTMRGFLGEMGGENINVWTVEDPVEMVIPGVDQISINAEAGNGWPNVLTGLRRSDLQLLMIGEIRNYDQASAALEIGNAGAKVLSSIHANDCVGAVQQLMELADAKPRTLGNQLRAVISQRLVRLMCTECATFDPDCPACDGDGYRGKQPIHEILILDEPFINALAAGKPTGELRAVAKASGMVSLRDTAQELIDTDMTTIQEVRRVLGND
jgi:type II secretory ATPase GspE/PulE/Tfp pilus assembly ATPase PilB-like protein